MGRKDKSETRKPEILENYFEVLKEEGFEGTSIAKIARRMDIHPSLIIHYFKTKEDMILALANLMFEKYIISGITDIRKIPNAKKRLEKLLDMMLFRHMEKKDQQIIFPALTYLASRKEEVRKQMRRNIEQIHGYMVEEMENLMNEGLVKRMNSDMLVRYIGMLGTGLEHHVMMFQNEDILNEVRAFLKETVQSFIIAV